MKQIDELTAISFIQDKELNKPNTKVVLACGGSIVQLHNSIIAEKTEIGFNLMCTYNSQTTLRRLNAILFEYSKIHSFIYPLGFKVRKGCVYFNSWLVSSTDIISIDINNKRVFLNERTIIERV